ncbi:MAG TPA: DinB family protein [Chitinophagaceae bacterium]|nr:DinB family protein [Chitinophagaceae bacterium]
MKKLILHLCLAAFAFLSAVKIQAQSLEAVQAQMVKDWERAKEYTKEYLNAMPADKYSFRAHDSVRSFAQQMLHLAAANVFLMSNVSSERPPAWLSFGLERRTSAQSRDSVVYYVLASYDYAINAVKSSPISQWGEVKKLFGRFDETKFAIINKTFEHQTHHRGQTTIYIRLLGIKPPEEKLF